MFHTHAKVQKYIPLPYFFNQLRFSLVPNLLYKNAYHQTIRGMIFTVFALYFIFDFVYVSYMLSNWSHLSKTHLDRLVAYTMRVCMDGFIALSVVVISTQKTLIQNLVTELCKLVIFDTTAGFSFIQNGFRKFKFRTYSFEELIFYFMVGVVPFSALCLFLSPFWWPFLPLQLCFGKSIVVKTLSSFHLGILWGYIIWFVVSTVQTAISIFELTKTYTGELIPNPGAIARSSGKYFITFYRKYRKTQILVSFVNQFIVYLSFGFIYVGVICASFCTHAMFTMWGRLPELIYFIFPVITLHIFGLSILVPRYIHIFNKNICKFFKYWNWSCSKKHDRQLLRSCPKLGIKAGTYGIITAVTGLQICDDVINNTVTLLLCF